jgi:hypothetical protein
VREERGEMVRGTEYAVRRVRGCFGVDDERKIGEKGDEEKGGKARVESGLKGLVVGGVPARVLEEGAEDF